MIELYGILNDFRREAMAFIYFLFGHAKDSGSLKVNLSVPCIVINIWF